jgi:hypothetical protein
MYTIMKKVFAITFTVMLLLTSCLPLFLCLTGNGKLITEYRDVTGYDFIINSTAINVTVVEADTFGLKLVIEENLADNIITSVSGGILEIRHSSVKNCINHTRTPSIIVSAPVISGVTLSGSGGFIAPELSGDDISIRLSGSGNMEIGLAESSTLQIAISGSGDISVAELVCDEATIKLSGSGDLSASGNAGHGIFSLSGSGDSYTRDFIMNTTSATITGSGNLHTYVTGSLNAIMSGSGNIYLKGNPSVHSNISGSGRIIKNK